LTTLAPLASPLSTPLFTPLAGRSATPLSALPRLAAAAPLTTLAGLIALAALTTLAGLAALAPLAAPRGLPTPAVALVTALPLARSEAFVVGVPPFVRSCIPSLRVTPVFRQFALPIDAAPLVRVSAPRAATALPVSAFVHVCLQE
jgi:hypothetical protein